MNLEAELHKILVRHGLSKRKQGHIMGAFRELFEDENTFKDMAGRTPYSFDTTMEATSLDERVAFLKRALFYDKHNLGRHRNPEQGDRQVDAG